MSTDNTPAINSFQYDLVDKPTASKLQMLANEISFIDRMACFEIGARLKAARDELKAQGKRDCGFKEWVESETNYSRRAAYELIQIHENLSAYFVRDRAQGLDGLSSFNYATLRQMASPSYPEEARTRLIEAAKAGEKITEQVAKEAKAEILKMQQEAEQAKREAEEMKRIKSEQDRKIAELEAQRQEAANRLERAKEEYIKLRDKAPEVQIIEKEVVPKPYSSLEQALEGKRNLLEQAEASMRKAKAEEKRAKEEIEKLQVELIRERKVIEEARNERSAVENANLKLSFLTTSLIAFLRNSEEAFLAINGDYIQYADAQLLTQVEEKLREVADKIAKARGVSAEYAEFRVVNA